MHRSAVLNAIYYLQRIQLLLKHLVPLHKEYKTEIEQWINETDECQKIFELNQIEHPLLEQCTDFLCKKLIQPFERQLEDIVHKNDHNLSPYLLEFNYVSKRFSLIKKYISDVIQVPLDDLFCIEANNMEWQNLNQFIKTIDLDEPRALAEAFAKFDDYIAIGCAYAKLGDKFKMNIFGALVQNLGGAYLLANIKLAKEIKLVEMTNPTIKFVQNLWSIQDKSQFLKNFIKVTMTPIKSHYKIYIPYLLLPTFTEEGILQEIHDNTLYHCTQEDELHFIEENLYEAITSPLLQKDRVNKIKIRLLSANKNIFRKNINYEDIVHQITELSKHHHNISPLKKQPKTDGIIKKVVIHIHGGGWVAMSSFSHQTYTRKWANRLGEDAIIFSIDYRLVPEHPYPNALEDIWQTYLWIIHFASFYLNVDPQQIVIAGDSAGGNMALGICYRAIKQGMRIPDGLLLAYPACNLNVKDFNPYLLNGMVDQIAPSTILTLVLAEYVKSEKLRPDIDPYLSPLYADAEFLKRLPKIIIMSGAMDSLTGDCLKFLNKMVKLKKDIKMYLYNGLSHGFMNFEVPLLAVPKIKPVIEQSGQLLFELFYYDFILGLNFFDLIKIKDLVEQEKDVETLKIDVEYNEIPLTFLDDKDYINIWEPLFFEETKANIIKCFQTENYPNIECNLIKVDKNEFDQIDLQVRGKNESINTRDVVIFSTEPLNEGVPNLLGLVEYNSEIIKINVKFPTEMENVTPFQTHLIQNIQNKKPFYLRKVTAISTLEREYKALHKINECLLKPIILSLESITKVHNYFQIPEFLNEKLKQKYNSSQYQAIQQTLKTQGITLIQGPPGTGKTKTVIGTLSVLLSSLQEQKERVIYHKELHKMELEQKNKQQSFPWLENNYEDWRDHIFDDVQEDLNNFYHFKKYIQDTPIIMETNDQLQVRCPEKILVCGPSNASVDEIIKKVLEEGLLDEFGHNKKQMIVRIGDNYDASLHHISLEGLVNQRMFEQKLKDDDIGKIRKDIISQAKIVFGTLSSTGSNLLLQCQQKFDTVIIDEAAQAVEISTLIPLQFGCRRLILIGDHNQLPATVFSKICEKFKYDQSLFERLEKQGAQVHLLKTQYRMHPKISQFISNSFYKGELNDADNLMQLIGQPEFYNYYTYSPIVILHVKGYEEFSRNSYMNQLEAQLISHLVQDIQHKFPKMDLQKLGIVSPYSSQIWQIKNQLKQMGELGIEVKTIDGFQGREKDIIIFSTVRSKFINEKDKNPKKGIGFLSDVRRMNVSLSRCRQCLIVVCDIFKISCNPIWRSLVNYGIQQGQCYRVNVGDIQNWFYEFDQNPLKFQITEMKRQPKVL